MPTEKEKAMLAARKQELLDKTAAFCRAHLDAEYHGLCIRLIEKMARKREVPFARGDLGIWAAAIVHALGSANFLFDDSFEPHVRAPQIAEFFKVSPKTVSQKASALRVAMKLDMFNTEFATAKMAEQQQDLQNMMLEMTNAMFSPADVADAPRFYTRAPEDGEFIDDDHEVMDEFYELGERFEQSGPTPAIEKALRALIARDPQFFDPHLLLADLLGYSGREEEAMEMVDVAYRGAVQLLTAQSGEWPRVLEWGWLENRHIMRALQTKATLLWADGDVDGALEILRRLLAGDKEDRLGARWAILAIRKNISPEKFDEMCSESGARVQKWFDKHAAEFPHEFSAWQEAAEKE